MGASRTPTDVELLADATAPSESFALFYERYAASIFAHCTARGLDPHEAADKTSEVFVAALAQRYRFTQETGDTAAPWLFGIARNVINGTNRRAEREQHALERLWLTLDPWGTDADAEGRVLSQERIQTVVTTLGDLTSEQRGAFIGRHVEARTYPELAALQGVSEAVVRRRVSRAIRAIRARLGGRR